MTLRELPWRMLAAIVSRPRVTRWLIARAQRTPYTHITSADGSDVYMGRWWLFNPHPSSGAPKSTPWLPSVRIHHIRRADRDRHLHDHPWNARTIVLRGWYDEERADGGQYYRHTGYTGRLLYGQYHRIAWVHPAGVWTLFITWKYRGTWGFDVDGVKVPWREYLGVQE